LFHDGFVLSGKAFRSRQSVRLARGGWRPAISSALIHRRNGKSR